jgi:quercetin dioxygenase-like cupin family protein
MTLNTKTQNKILANKLNLKVQAKTVKINKDNVQSQTRAPKMEIKRSCSQTSTKGQADYFTGNVRIDPLFQGNDPARAVGASVTFEPSARTAWHTHPLGQTLIVTAGCGLVQYWGGPVEEIHPGDIVWISPSEKHWHGASAATAMTHIAIQEQLGGKIVNWMEKVSDEQYQGHSQHSNQNG